MDREITAEERKEDASVAPQGDTAATTPAAPVNRHVKVEEAPQFMGTPPAQKRNKTAGEIVFDVGTYGGLSFLGNEALSTLIMDQTAEKGIFHKMYEASAKAVSKTPVLNKLKYVGEGRAAYLLWATLGGFALVLPVKWMEDRKGSIVRKIDNFFHGRNSDDNPDTAAAHAEMDNAPKQSWSSLGEGRLVTVGSALAMDSLIGWPKAPIAKLFDKPGKLNDYAGIDRLSASFARWMGKKFDPAHRGAIDHVLATVHDVEHRYKIDPKVEGRFAKTVSIASMVMTISGALTLLFYASSKAFARGQQLRQDQRSGIVHAPTGAATTVTAGNSQATVRAEELDTTPDAQQDTGKPQPTNRVASVENLSRMAAETPQVTV